MRYFPWIIVLGVAAACSDAVPFSVDTTPVREPEPDGEPDAEPDAETPDAGVDAGKQKDAGKDADAGKPPKATAISAGIGHSCALFDNAAIKCWGSGAYGSLFRHLQQSPSGRQKLRARVQVEHALAHVTARKGDRARYIGVRKNLFDLRRAAAIQNLETAQRIERELAALAALAA